MSFERGLAEWAATVRVHSELAQTRVRDALVDVIACIVSGVVGERTQSVIRVAERAGAGACGVMGTSVRVSSPWAALIAGTAAHALDFDDNFAPAVTHASAVLAPALFALADEDGRSGMDIVQAYIVGLELQARIGWLANPEHYEKGWHATSTIGAIGTAGACARLLGLNADEIRAAMSIAFSMAAGSKRQFGSMMKPIHAGLAAKNAVLAARMAQAGISGDRQTLNGHWAFSDLYGGQSDQEDRLGAALDGFGERLAIETVGLMPKRFPCCASAHRTLDGLVSLRQRHEISLQDVDHVEAYLPAFARANLRFDSPQNENEARFSLTYCAARVLQTGNLMLNDLTMERVQDPLIRPWLDRIQMQIKPGSVAEELSANATPAITRIVMKGGQTYETGVVIAKGMPQCPFTPEEITEKFRDCCRWAGREHDTDRLFELALSIPSLERFSGFSGRFA